MMPDAARHVREAELLARIDQVPALPAVVSAILSMAGNDESSADELDRLISQDMVIAGRLLNLVNSSFYNLSNRVNSLQQAVAIVGFHSLRSLVIAASVSPLLRLDLSVYSYEDTGLWRNSAVCAGLAKELATITQRGSDTADNYFIGALLRNVGMLVIGPYLFDKKVAAFKSDPSRDILTQEREIIGFDHAWAGDHVAEKWELPEQMRVVITRHRRIPRDIDPETLQMLASIRVCDRLVANANVGLQKDHPFDTVIDPILLDSSGVDAEVLRHLIGRLPEIIASADEME